MFGILGHETPLAEVAQALTGSAETHREAPDNYGGHSVTVNPLGLSKWVGVLAYCEQAGIDPGRVLAIGDGPNDCELLAGARSPSSPRAGAPLHSNWPTTSRATADGGWAQLLDFL